MAALIMKNETTRDVSAALNNSGQSGHTSSMIISGNISLAALGAGYHSNNENQPSFLPEIKRVFSKSSQRTTTNSKHLT